MSLIDSIFFKCYSLLDLSSQDPVAVRARTTKYTRNTLTYLYKHLVDVNGILGAGFYKDGMDGVSIVLGILLWHFPGDAGDGSEILCCNLYTVSQISCLT